MPTFETSPGFEAGWRNLTRQQQDRFRKVVLEAFTPDLTTEGRSFRPGLRVKKVTGHAGLYEMSWSEDGRAAFSYGAEQAPGEVHVIWWQITVLAEPFPAGTDRSDALWVP